MRGLDAGLTSVQRAEFRAWHAYVEELVYPAAGWIQTRFGYPEDYAKLKKEAVGKTPWFDARDGVDRVVSVARALKRSARWAFTITSQQPTSFIYQRNYTSSYITIRVR